MLRCYIGYDEREDAAYQVARSSLLRRASVPVDVIPLHLRRLTAQGLMRRPLQVVDRRTLDVVSGAPQATEFACSRFLVPLLAQQGPALFVDCDVVFLADVAELLQLYDPRKAVQVVQHQAALWDEAGDQKMDGQAQMRYARKCWSSVVLWNCGHPAHAPLTLDAVNGRPGRDLHAFAWLPDDLIGELPPEWNWLVRLQPKPETPKIAHLTLGGPWFADWIPQEHDEIWHEEARAA